MPASFDNTGTNDKLSGLRAKEEEDLAQLLAGKYGLTYTDLGVMSIDGDALRVIPEATAKKAQVVAFAKTSKRLSLALQNPNNPELQNVLEGLSRDGYTFEQYLVSEQGLAHALSRYADLTYAHTETAGVFDIKGEELARIEASDTSVAAVKAHLEELIHAAKTADTSRLFEEIVAGALALGASDIHLEPEEESVRLRFRLDGLLTDVYFFEAKAYRQLNSRIKLLSGVKLNITDRAQDGRFTIQVNENEIEVRTSVLPGNYGESVVMRILDPRSIEHTLSDLGIGEKLLTRLRAEITRPNGMLINTGPTGSGKTTSLYTFLREIHTPDIKIVTIEDPIEYHLTGIVQTQTNGKDYTFASGMRSVLRQDPDVIMVGEIRDKEVAETAIQAALTGHFVFSTLHTNNAAGTFPRLIDLGADPKVFASAVTVAMAQRLLRMLDSTKKARPATDAEKKMMQTALSTLADQTLLPKSFDTVYDAVPGTDGSTGYKGRTGVYEAIFMDDELGQFLRDNPAESDVAKHVVRQGFPTMLQDGVLKVLAGTTTLDELARVVDLPR